jgi:uncharacterized protein (TIGR02594 family)
MQWIEEAKRHLGLTEIPGPKHNPTIQKWLVKLKAWWSDDETPWCGVFVAHCIDSAGLPLPKHWYRAKGWLEWGTKINTPVPGCVCVIDRKGGGHVFFVLGRSASGDLIGIGGNQGNRVSIAAFPTSRVVGYRWPSGVPVPNAALPIMSASSSHSEA